MDLITVHEDHFCLCSTSPKKSCEDIWSIATAGKLVRHYPEVFVKDLGTLPGTVHLKVDENAEPSITPSRQILTALREKFKAQLDHLEKLGELTKVNEPTAWVSTVVIATKKSGALRICIDPRPLNQALKRDTHQLLILDDLYQSWLEWRTFQPLILPQGTGTVCLTTSPVSRLPLQPPSEDTGGKDSRLVYQHHARSSRNGWVKP